MNHYTLHYFLIIWYAIRPQKNRFRCCCTIFILSFASLTRTSHFILICFPFCIRSFNAIQFVWIIAYNSTIALQHIHTYILCDIGFNDREIHILHWKYIRTNVKITCSTLISTVRGTFKVNWFVVVFSLLLLLLFSLYWFVLFIITHSLVDFMVHGEKNVITWNSLGIAHLFVVLLLNRSLKLLCQSNERVNCCSRTVYDLLLLLYFVYHSIKIYI